MLDSYEPGEIVLPVAVRIADGLWVAPELTEAGEIVFAFLAQVNGELEAVCILNASQLTTLDDRADGQPVMLTTDTGSVTLAAGEIKTLLKHYAFALALLSAYKDWLADKAARRTITMPGPARWAPVAPVAAG